MIPKCIALIWKQKGLTIEHVKCKFLIDRDHTFVCGAKALSPKSETLRDPCESRSKFSGCKRNMRHP